MLGQEISGRDLILILGGLFLLAKSTYEIHDKLEGRGRARLEESRVVVRQRDRPDHAARHRVLARFGDHRRRDGGQVLVMVAAVITAVAIMMMSAEPISAFVNRHPTVKMLALSFLLLIGMSLVAEGFDQHIPKGYIYFAMGFSVFVEMLNLRLRGRREPVHLHERYTEEV